MPNPRQEPRNSLLRALRIELRDGRSLTQVDIGARYGKPQSYIFIYVRGKRRLDIVEMISVASALETDLVFWWRDLINGLS